MAWIESHQALEKHPKVLRLSRLAQWTVPETIGKLHIFWWWCLDYAPDGQLDKFDVEVIANVFGVTQDAQKFVVQTLTDVGFVDFAPQLRVHDWWDYAGRFLQVRYKRTPKMWKEIKRLYGDAKQPTNNRTTTGLSAINNHKPNQPNQTKPNQPNQIQEKTIPASHTAGTRDANTEGVVVDAKEPAVGSETWAAYSQAYVRRYGTLPVRNKQINAQLKKLVEYLGPTEAPQVAAFYLTCTLPLYVTARHPTNLLLRDATGLHTQWATGTRATSVEARSAEMKTGMNEQLKRVTGRTQLTINVTPITQKGTLPHGTNSNTDDPVESHGQGASRTGLA